MDMNDGITAKGKLLDADHVTLFYRCKFILQILWIEQ